MDVSDSVALAVQPVDGKYGQVLDAHAVPNSCSFGKGMTVNGHLHCARVYDEHDDYAAEVQFPTSCWAPSMCCCTSTLLIQQSHMLSDWSLCCVDKRI